MTRRLLPLALRFALPFGVLIAAAGCASEAEPQTAPAGAPDAAPAAVGAPAAASADLPYDFAAPALAVELPAALREVSGVARLPDGRFLAVQDEAGTLYTLDAATGAVVEERAFAGAGDYEDVAYTDGTAWVLQSNGTLVEVPDGDAPVREHDTPLKGKCDAEGLALDAARNRLLVACKEDPGEGLDEDAVRAVYAFDLAARSLDASPAYILDRRALDADENFKPSALAVHPSTGEPITSLH